MKVFVFPLAHVVFYPSVSKPINIFEPRYIQMVRDSIQQNIPIALAYADNDKDQHPYYAGKKLDFVREIAGYGTALIMEEHGGSMLQSGMTIFLQGQGKLRLGPVLDEQTPYIICDAEVVQENLVLSGEGAQDLTLIHKLFINWVNANVTEQRNRDQFMQLIQTPSEIIGCFVSYLILDPDLQQIILEENNINEKIAIIKRLIESGGTNLFPA